jgi:hypothetical protein
MHGGLQTILTQSAHLLPIVIHAFSGYVDPDSAVSRSLPPTHSAAHTTQRIREVSLMGRGLIATRGVRQVETERDGIISADRRGQML